MFERLETPWDPSSKTPEVRRRLLLTASQDLMEEQSEVQREAIGFLDKTMQGELPLYENFRQHILEAIETVKKRRAKLTRLIEMRSRRTAKHHKKITRTPSCPRCRTALTCLSCGWTRKCKDLPNRMERSWHEMNKLGMSKIYDSSIIDPS